MADQNQVTPFVWGDISLSQTVMIDGVPHSTKPAMGEWAEYADPRDAINKILERNPYIEEYSVAVKLTATDGKKYDTFVYHPIGFLLIVMESGQPKAREMKQAVAKFVWHFAGPRKLTDRMRLELMKLRMLLITKVSAARDAFEQAALLSDLREVSFTLGLPVPDVALLGTDAKQLMLKGV